MDKLLKGQEKGHNREGVKKVENGAKINKRIRYRIYGKIAVLIYWLLNTICLSLKYEQANKNIMNFEGRSFNQDSNQI